MSKACLDHKKGMHFDCISSMEFQVDDNWYRAELYRKDDGSVSYAGYQRIGVYWKPVTSMEEATNEPCLLDRVCLHLLHQFKAENSEELKL